MNKLKFINKKLLIILVLLGLLVLISYIPILKTYCDDYWAGIAKLTRNVVITPLMISAAVGFLAWSWYYLRKQHSTMRGLFSKKYLLESMVAILLLFSALWSLFVYLSVIKSPTKLNIYMTSLCLFVVALSSIFLVVGTLQDGASTGAFAGVLALSVVTLLVDGVAWNFNWLNRKG